MTVSGSSARVTTPPDNPALIAPRARQRSTSVRVPGRSIPNATVIESTNWRTVMETLAFAYPAASVSPITRTLECLIAAALLIATSPIMLLVAIIIRIDSPGPILFRQPRVGTNGRLFQFTKFRTLYVDAKARWPELYAYRYSPQQLEGLHFKVQNDPRVTRVGRWLRKSTLDELPNLWHVLLGEMALVGPRPEIPEMLPYYDRHTLKKFSVRPGVTGLAQVSGRGNLSFYDTVKYDVDYVERRSSLLDVKILASTVYRTALRDGAF